MRSGFLLVPSRKRLFSNIYISGDSERTCKRLHQFLVVNPVARSFVRNITICWEWNSSISTSLSSTPVLSDEFRYVTSWNDFSSELQYAISTIIHSSTLETPRLYGLVLFQGVHLTKLALWSSSQFDLGGKQLGLTLAASHMVVEYCHDELKIFDSETLSLPFMPHLRVFEIFIDQSTKIPDLEILSFILLVSLSSSATLEHLKICIISSDSFDCDAFFRRLSLAEAWKHLNSFITHPSGSRLQRVDINIKHSFRFDDGTEFVKLILDALPLLREKGILFVEAKTVKPSYPRNVHITT